MYIVDPSGTTKVTKHKMGIAVLPRNHSYHPGRQ